MLCATLVAWMSVAAAPSVEAGDVLEAGLYPAQVLLDACAEVDRSPNLSAGLRFTYRALRLWADLEISERTLTSMHVALVSAGIHRIPYVDRMGRPFAFVTLDPHQLPKTKCEYEVVVVQLRHADPTRAAEALNALVEKEEGGLDDDVVRTLFVPVAKSARLVVRYTSAERLEKYRELLRELDADPRGRARSILLRSWVCRVHRADELAEKFGAAWAKTGRDKVEPVVSRGSNSLLFRCSQEDWKAIQDVLLKLDAQ